MIGLSTDDSSGKGIAFWMETFGQSQVDGLGAVLWKLERLLDGGEYLAAKRVDKDRLILFLGDCKLLGKQKTKKTNAVSPRSETGVCSSDDLSQEAKSSCCVKNQRSKRRR